VPEGPKAVMASVLASIPNRHGYLRGSSLPLKDEGKHQHRDRIATEEPHLFDEFASSNELHGNFRMFASFGKAAMVEACLTSEAAKEYFLGSSSQKHDETALTLAAKHAQTEVVALLLDHGQPDLEHLAPGGAALTWACRGASSADFKKNEPKIIAAAFALLVAGAKPNTENEHGHTALDYAVANESPALVALLRRFHAEPGENPRSSSERCLLRSGSTKGAAMAKSASKKKDDDDPAVGVRNAAKPEDLVESTTFGLPPSLKRRLVDALKVKPANFKTIQNASFFLQANERFFQVEDQHCSVDFLTPALADALFDEIKATVGQGGADVLAGLDEKLNAKIRSSFAAAPPLLKEEEHHEDNAPLRVSQIDAESLQILVVTFTKKMNQVANGACPPCSNLDLVATLRGKITFVQAKDHASFIALQVTLVKDKFLNDLTTLLYKSLDTSAATA